MSEPNKGIAEELIDGQSKTDAEEGNELTCPVRPPHWKMKFLSLLVGMLTLGFCASLQGPTLPDLEELFNTDTASLSGAITANNVGFLLGSLICGLIFERMNYELQIALDGVLVGLFNLLPPWTGSLAGLIGTSVLAGATRGFYVTGIQAYLLYLLKGHRLQDSSQLVMQAAWSLGATVGPLIVQPFLSPVPYEDYYNSTSNYELANGTTTNGSSANMTDGSINQQIITNISSVSENIPATKVGYAYVTLGLLTAVLSLPMWILFATGPKKIFVKQRKAQSKTSSENRATQTKCFKGVMLVLLFLWFLSYIVEEILPSNFLATWSLKSLHWPKYAGSLLTSTIAGSVGIGRIIGIFIAVVLSARQMLFICVTLTTISYVILTAFYRMHAAIIWTCLVFAGLGMSCSFGASVMWASRHITITGPVSAVFFTGLSVGQIVSPIPTAYLFQVYSPDWLLYIILMAAGLNLIIVVLLELLVKLFKKGPDNTNQIKETELMELNNKDS